MSVAVDIPEEKAPLGNFENSKSDSKPTTPSENVSAKKQRYRDQLYSAIRSLPIKGLSKALGNTHIKYKVFWVVVFVMALIVFIINLRNITARYLKFPILTQLERVDRPFTWPQFTFCSPANPIPFWKNRTLLSKWKSVVASADTNYSLPLYDPDRQRKIWEHYMSISTINPQEFYRDIVRGSIFQVYIMYGSTSAAAYSSPSDLYRKVKKFDDLFQVTMMTIRSPIACFTLRPDKLKAAVKEIRDNTHPLLGIKLYVLMDVQSYLNYDIGFENRKLYFYVTKPDSTIFFQFPNYVLPGTDSTFIMKQKVHKRIAHCTKKKFEFKLYHMNMVDTVKYNGSYEVCRTFLSQKLFVERCGCYNPYLPVFWLPNTPPRLCINMTLYNNSAMSRNIDCLNKVLEDVNHSQEFNGIINRTCSEYQRSLCYESSYTVTRFTTAWQDIVSESRKENLLKGSSHLPNAPTNITDEFPRNNLAIIKLEWGREKTEATFEQYEYPLSRYMSDFGGILGLWIGLSAFSFFEFLEIFYKFIKYIRVK